jgi:tetratricopeptide (TPR) repeat protein
LAKVFKTTYHVCVKAVLSSRPHRLRVQKKMRRCIYFGFVVAIAGLCVASSGECVPSAALQAKFQKQPTADTYGEAGIWYSEHHKYECAIEAYRSALQKDPNSAEFTYLLGLNLTRKGDVSGAVKSFQQSIELRPAVLKPHLLLATTLEELGRGSEARTQWLAALKINPHSEIALDGASKNFLATHDFDAVVALLGPEPEGDNLTLDLALAHRGAGRIDQAVAVLRKGLENAPSSQALTNELVMDFFSQRRYHEAVQLAKELVDRSPQDLNAEILYLHALVLNDDEELARPLAKKLLAAAPRDFTVLYLNGTLENRSGNYAASRVYLEKAVAINPNHYDSRYTLGLVLSNLNDPRGAREQFEKALALGAPDPGVRFQYVKVLRTLGEADLAQEQFKLYQQEEQAKADRTLAATKMGQADEELNKGDARSAAQLYRDAIAALPDYALLQYKLSVALDQSGDIDGEREALRKAVEIDSRMAIAHRQLGYLAFNEGDFATAELHFRQAVEAAPAFTDAWVSLAAALASESRHQEAVEAVKRALEIDPQNANAIELDKELAKAANQAHP